MAKLLYFKTLANLIIDMDSAGTLIYGFRRGKRLLQITKVY